MLNKDEMNHCELSLVGKLPIYLGLVATVLGGENVGAAAEMIGDGYSKIQT